MAVGDGAALGDPGGLRKDPHYAGAAQPDNARSDRAANGTQRNQLGASAWPGATGMCGPPSTPATCSESTLPPGRSPGAHIGGFPIGIAVAGGSVWVIDNSNATVIRLDPSTLRVIGQPVSLPSGDNFYLGASDGYVFIADDSAGTSHTHRHPYRKTAGRAHPNRPSQHDRLRIRLRDRASGNLDLGDQPDLGHNFTHPNQTLNRQLQGRRLS